MNTGSRGWLAAAWLAAMAAGALLLVHVPPDAFADCGGVVKESPSHKRAHHVNPKGRPPLASVTISTPC